MVSLMNLAARAAVSFAALAALGRADDGRATAGRTDGEPGQGEHCCGMKGLGGATVQVLCSPQQVAPGMPFTVNVAYQTDVKRPVDIHVDVLNAQTKAFYAGSTTPVDYQKGQLSANIVMAVGATEPFLWKVFVAPRGEPFPNMLAETGFVAHIGDSVIGDCPQLGVSGYDLAPAPVDSMRLTSVPPTVPIGGYLPIGVSYSLVSQDSAVVTASLMRKATNTLISEGSGMAYRGDGALSIPIQVPADIASEPVYVVATLVPPGKTWNDRLAEDRTYNIALSRRLRA